MAYFGLTSPIIAKNTAGVYSDGFTCGKAVSMEVAPNYVEGSLYADDEQAEYEKSFQNATVTMGTSTLPASASTVMFGHTVATDTETSAGTDESNYVGVGFIVEETVDGAKTFFAVILTKVKFSDPSYTFSTKGDSITFATPSVSGMAIPDSDQSGTWRIKKSFTTSALALAYINTTFHIGA